MPDLLIELFSEEIPARMQARAASDLQKLMTDGMVEAGLTYASAKTFATPRRLALTVEGLTDGSPTLTEERRGPKVGAPDKAIEGFCRGAGVAREDLEEREEKKGSFYFAKVTTPGRPAAEIVAEVLEATVRNFPWPKSMRWGTGSLRWVRPLHTILCILTREDGAKVVPLDVDGITSDDTTRGHRFHAPEPFAVTSFDDYAAKLKRAHVVLDAEERAAAIWNDATNMAFAAGLEVVEDAALLREVAGLVEWPVVLMGEIGEQFMELPPEVLQTSMREHQKFFSVRNAKSGRIERFITVANRETADNGATILAGNKKVLTARLADAVFFWENDLRVAKAGMGDWLDSLKNVTFHNKLGTVADQIDRIAALSRELAPITGADPDEAEEAARLAKADLASEMVYEFPELQGVMGRYYIEKAGKSAAIAAAAEAHYAPLGPSDDVPTNAVSVSVALAEKLDKLVGFWAIGEKPTGSKDPFALRRSTLGVIRLILANDLEIHLVQTLHRLGEMRLDEFTFEQMQVSSDDVRNVERVTGKKLTEIEKLDIRTSVERNKIAGQYIAKLVAMETDLLSFIHDRLKVYLRDEGLRHDVIDACIAMEGNDDLAKLVARARALGQVLATEDGENLVQGFKRANNILTQAEEKDGVEYSYGADRKYVEQAEENRAL